MPSKDLEVRRATWRRWAEKNRSKDSVAYKKYLARQAAQAKYPELKTCSVLGCYEIGERHHPDYQKRLEIVWLCKTHHEEVHHGINKCKLCDSKRFSRGYCSKHYKQIRKQEDPEYATRVSEIRRKYHERTGK